METPSRERITEYYEMRTDACKYTVEITPDGKGVVLQMTGAAVTCNAIRLELDLQTWAKVCHMVTLAYASYGDRIWQDEIARLLLESSADIPEPVNDLWDKTQEPE